MEIEKIINRWFDETQNNLTKTKDSSDMIDGLCRTISSVFKTYCDATIRLLEHDPKVLPAMALLRIMSELIIKSLWCLNVTKNEEIKERIKRWEKAGVKKRKKFVKELLESEGSFDPATVDKFKQELAKLDEYLKDNIVDEMPKVTGPNGLFKETKNIFDRNICAQAYRQFNHAVHVDTLVLTWSTQRKANAIYYTGDLDENIESLKLHCLSFSYMVIKVVYVHYGWKSDQIEEEYQKALSDYTANS